jgi:hypothetical protein
MRPQTLVHNSLAKEFDALVELPLLYRTRAEKDFQNAF